MLRCCEKADHREWEHSGNDGGDTVGQALHHERASAVKWWLGTCVETKRESQRRRLWIRYR